MNDDPTILVVERTALAGERTVLAGERTALSGEPPRLALQETAASGQHSIVTDATLHSGKAHVGPVAVPPRVGRFLVIRTLGAGGMGVVAEAYDPELDRRVALKLLKSDHARLDSQTRLLREAQAMARLSHPNVVQVYDVGVVGDQVFIAMELVRGQTLGAWLDARPRGWREVVRVFIDAGRGLAAAHAAGLVHRDFKPKPSRPPPKAPLSAKRRGSPTIGAFEGRRFAQEWSEVVRMAQSWPKIEARSCHTPSEA